MHFTLTSLQIASPRPVNVLYFMSIKTLLFASFVLLASSLVAADHDNVKKAVPAKSAEAAPVAGSTSLAATKLMPLNEVKTGMRGVAYTVFEGTKPEAMEVEVLGV